MSDELQKLWQSQETDAPALRQSDAGWSTEDLAVPTSQFRARPSNRRTVFLAVAAVLVFAVGVGKYQLGLMRGNEFARPPPPRDDVELDPAEERERLLSECRSFSSPASGEPDFERAEFACRGALALEPLHHEATQLLRDLARLRTCQTDFNRGMEASSSRPDEALEAFARVTKDCETYFVRANGIAREMVPAALERAKRSCANPLDEGCQRWVNLECQRSGLADERVAAWSSVHRDWSCPSWEALRVPVPVDDGRAAVRTELRARYTDLALGEVLVAWFDGDLNEARARTATLTSNEARALSVDIRRAGELQLKTRIELASISGPGIDRAAPFAREFLDVDERLMLGEGATRLSLEERKRALARLESRPRRELIAALARGAYERGKALADRKDFRGACRAWKLGAEFSRGDLDLLKALTNVCTKKAAAAFDAATTCEQLQVVKDFAVPGDGYAEKVDERVYTECNE